MKKLFALWLMLCTLTVAAQNPLIRTDLIPASPNAGSIAKAGEVPLNLSAGLPSVSVPIFNVQGNDLSIPISINYNYDGLKPAQSASWVGLGWSLEAGGVITRSVRDKVDGTMGAHKDYDTDTVQNNVNGLTPSQDFLHAAAANYDTEPDIYSFNFPGYSGKFIKYKGKFYTFPTQKLAIAGGDSGYTIITENGTKYTFDEIETTLPKGTSGAPYNLPTSYHSAWYLTKIENASGTEVITLEYDSEGKLANTGSYTQTYKKPVGFSDIPIPAPSSAFPTYVQPKRLKKITSEKFTVQFIPADSLRLDLDQNYGGSAKALKKVLVSSNTGLVKDFRFHTSYSGPYLRLDSVQDCRMPLDIEEEYPVPDTLTHKFEYYEITASSKQFARVDHYGFYMGGGDFSDMLIPNTYHSSGPDRTPNFGGTVQGAMSKVTYPSGGYSTFSYESNYAYDGANYQSDSHLVSLDVSRGPAGGTHSTHHTYPLSIVITEGQDVSVTVTRTPYTAQGDNVTHNEVHDFEIYDSVGVVLSGIIADERDNGGKIFTGHLNPGTYTFTVKADPRESYISASFYYTTLSSKPSIGKLAGGLRIKSMGTFPQAGPPLQREYSYTDAAGFSSGHAPSDTYDIKPWTDINVYVDRIEDKDFNIISSYVPESYELGLPHHYSSVVEKQIAGTDTLFTRHDFRGFGNPFMGTVPLKVTQFRKNGSNVLVPANIKSYDYGEVTDTAFRYLKPYQIMQVNLLGGMYPSKQYEFAYELGTTSAGWKYLKGTRDVTYEGTDSLVVVTKNTYDDNRNLAYTTTTNSNGEVLVSKFKYPESYSSGFSAMLSAHVLSPVVEQQTWNRNSSDSVLVSGGITEYSTTHFKPIKQYLLNTRGINALNNESKTGTLYDNLISDSRYEERADYTYNSTGRLVTQQLTSGIPVSYQWGYASIMPTGYTNTGQMNYPIAEVKNALPTEFYTENFEEHGSATSGPAAHSGNKYYNGDFAVTWTKPNSRNYSISFFYKSSGKWYYKKQAYTGSVTLSDGDAIDDVAIYPDDAQLSSYTYFEGIGNRSAIDTKGNMVSYEYDKMNRLENIKDQNGDIVKNYSYNQGTNNNLYYNTAKSGNFYKNNCTSGLLGTMVTYTVPANTFMSTSSQSAADALATAAVTANGQAYANANGTCTAGITLNFMNDTMPYYVDGPLSGAITGLVFKDASGNVLYTFDQTDVENGITVPQGTYTMTFTVTGPMFDLYTNMGWIYCAVATSTDYSEFYNIDASTYTISGVVLTTSTGVIYMGSSIF